MLRVHAAPGRNPMRMVGHCCSCIVAELELCSAVLELFRALPTVSLENESGGGVVIARYLNLTYLDMTDASKMVGLAGVCAS